VTLEEVVKKWGRKGEPKTIRETQVWFMNHGNRECTESDAKRALFMRLQVREGKVSDAKR